MMLKNICFALLVVIAAPFYFIGGVFLFIAAVVTNLGYNIKEM